MSLQTLNYPSFSPLQNALAHALERSKPVGRAGLLAQWERDAAAVAQAILNESLSRLGPDAPFDCEHFLKLCGMHEPLARAYGDELLLEAFGPPSVNSEELF